MSRKTKYFLDEKLKGINDIGELNLIISTKNKCYSDSLKLKAVEDYLTGKGSLRDICNIYGISCPRLD
ncbi:transposase [Clostridium botulinum]|uniref:transposase n=1 Tax=Clostridium botulinum TaxID=1491 RepID=UPI0019681618|nr:transposase [Clostridium botulinum]MBN1064489.1 transposase [Clostridium botulinum]